MSCNFLGYTFFLQIFLHRIFSDQLSNKRKKINNYNTRQDNWSAALSGL